jgi:hypothetical protein
LEDLFGVTAFGGKMQNDFAVGCGLEDCSFILQTSTQCLKVCQVSIMTKGEIPTLVIDRKRLNVRYIIA